LIGRLNNQFVIEGRPLPQKGVQRTGIHRPNGFTGGSVFGRWSHGEGELSPERFESVTLAWLFLTAFGGQLPCIRLDERRSPMTSQDTPAIKGRANTALALRVQSLRVHLTLVESYPFPRMSEQQINRYRQLCDAMDQVLLDSHGLYGLPGRLLVRLALRKDEAAVRAAIPAERG
jgi:hypothetical protein